MTRNIQEMLNPTEQQKEQILCGIREKLERSNTSRHSMLRTALVCTLVGAMICTSAFAAVSFGLMDGLCTFLQPATPQQEELLAMAGRLSTRVDLNRILRQTVLEETRKCMKGEESADEAVNAIMQKINLYLAE